MRSLAFVVPGRIETRTGGYVYDRRMAEGLLELGWPVEIKELDGAYPFPSQTALARAADAFAAIRDGSLVVVDGLALGALPDVIEREAPRLRIVALVHLPLAADLSIDLGVAARLEAAERRALAAASLVIVTGKAALPMLARYQLPRDRIAVVEPGTDPAPLARAAGGGPLRLLCVATLNPNKGHELLLRALADVAHADWRLTCAGSLTRHPTTVDRVRATARTMGLGNRVLLVGDLDAAALADCYRNADVFVLASLQETYGMAVAEALARGLPIVGTSTGAIPQLVGKDAGLLVPPGNTEALAEALARVIDDAALRARLTEGARRVRDGLPTWKQAVREMSTALSRLASNE
jgi:glycosyltransferase involved in cell wall biosynthesis